MVRGRFVSGSLLARIGRRSESWWVGGEQPQQQRKVSLRLRPDLAKGLSPITLGSVEWRPIVAVRHPPAIVRTRLGHAGRVRPRRPRTSPRNPTPEHRVSLVQGVARELDEIAAPRACRFAREPRISRGFGGHGCAMFSIKSRPPVPRAHTAHKACFMRHFAVEVPRLDPRRMPMGNEPAMPVASRQVREAWS